MTIRERDSEAFALVSCPHCAASASVEWQSTGGGMQYRKTHCVQGHWFLLPSTMIDKYPAAEPVGTAAQW